MEGIYQHLIEKLIYLTLTRPDIIYIVNVVSQFIHVPTNVLMHTAEHILYYLKKNLENGLLFMRYGGVNI